MEPVEHKYDVSELKDLIREHVALHRLRHAASEILDTLRRISAQVQENPAPRLRPHAARSSPRWKKRAMNSEQAQIEAFYAMKNAQ